MSTRFARLLAIAVNPVPQPTESDNVMLKVCPRCQTPHSKSETVCKRCTKRAKKIERILKLQDIRKRKETGQEVSEKELELLKNDQKLSFVEITPQDETFLAEAPFELTKDLIVVRPTFKNRLQFFMDRMQEKGRKVTTTYAATKLLKFDSKTDFVNFAIDNGVKSLMTADWDQHYAAWRVEDILKLFQERQAEKATRTVVERQPSKVMTSTEASNMLKIPGTQTFIDLATEFGIKPAQTFGDKPEQMTWHITDVKALRRVNELNLEASRMEEAIQRLERDITALHTKPMKWPDIQAFREKTEHLKLIRNELTKIEQLLKQEGLKLQELAEKHEQTPKEASNKRLMQLLALA